MLIGSEMHFYGNLLPFRISKKVHTEKNWAHIFFRFLLKRSTITDFNLTDGF